ncbi:membrane-spanning 4-domains subfamily A member 3 [Diceros bicornis minor]|uniref:Membrane-spanning 4-domains subfamily A member 3 n=1 Tax=Diceros bicornis minor TaxID=77932 RepID=A0A7J7FHD8_DICBM|nr:membrane-spanning 4-domains subfamily A member 3 [Diceros bicornis minor]XP_058382755.1 membrane-spanning 4-domains subfamily A member 3 [Diceros bicornis minor]XP_058382756.1 membrane-spanning 4-domains subfamily A member 3 [Diceros bicornis minor]XP_058382757.1 membrane-spanning 4-domains subfamily A member 3 [Diceros bicornis minor]KAF5927387.1 hypothetical protein HPG69_018987 [Diceros bicornis minor]
MASQELGNAELGTASASGTPGSHVEPGVVKNSAYQPIDRSQNYQKVELQALGAIQILNGAIILALGVFLGSLQSLPHLLNSYLFTFYTGYPLWGTPFYIISGSLSVAAGIKPTRKLVETSYGINMSSATISLTGFIILSVHLAVNKLSIKTCPFSQSPDSCIYMGAVANGLVSIMLIFTFLELCITVFLSIIWFRANCCHSREAISPPPNSVESGMPPDESKSENKEIQLQVSQ